MIKTLASKTSMMDANEAVASVAYRLSELFAIYPITPSSPMGEWVDEWSAKNMKNLWGHTPQVLQLQSEGGAAGTLHGALQAGSLASSFTASQGLLLMIPNLYKIAGELTPFVLHVTARAVATHALSIFGDHSDVMACRQTGMAMLCSNSPQEAQDFAAIAHIATLKSRVPILHFFDGFRTSHEIQKIKLLSNEDLQAIVDEEQISAYRSRALTPDHPAVRGTAQNPDVFFQAREAANIYIDAFPAILEGVFEEFAARTGRAYKLYEYEGAADAEEVVIVMGSAAETCVETSSWLNARGGKTGVLKVRLYRPFDAKALMAALPSTVRRVAVLDRTKEPGALGEPLFLDFMAALAESERAGQIKVIGGRYGLGSKEFSPGMAKSVFAELKTVAPKARFTVGIIDDVTKLSLDWDSAFEVEPEGTRCAVFYGLGSDGTVGANKNSIKIIGEETELEAQGYFVYDSKKAGAMTVSHLRFGPSAIRAPYLINRADFVAVHHEPFISQIDTLACAREGATLLLNMPSCASPEEAWSRLPRDVQAKIIAKKLTVYSIDALTVARSVGMGGQINTIMQTCFFALSQVLDREVAIAAIKKYIRKTYGKKGEAVVKKNEDAVDAALAGLHQVVVPAATTALEDRPPIVSPAAPDFVQRVTAKMLSGEGDYLPVSAFPPDGTWPLSTARWEKRNLAADIPTWDASICIQCNKCVLVCPHAAIRSAAYPTSCLDSAPENFSSIKLRSPEVKDHSFTIQVAPEDCTGCSLCSMVCPAKSKTDPTHKALNMAPQPPIRDQERANFSFFETLPPPPEALLQGTVKGSQFRQPLFEFSGACAGCGETPYLKLLTQMLGDRLYIANATGCSSIYGGNLPTTPYCTDRDGRGPAWSNSLFEDNAEYGLGVRAGIDQLATQAKALVREFAATGLVSAELAAKFAEPDNTSDAFIYARRMAVKELKELLSSVSDSRKQRLYELSDYLVPKSVWIVGGDGWAYDIGFGGLDHVLASGANVKIMILDTEVYSNTGGQRSKSTPLGAVAKFSAAGKETDKKDLAAMMSTYGNVYVARIAMGAKDSQTVQALQEAEAHNGPALIIAYSPCVAHGFALRNSIDHQKLAVESGHWPLMRYKPGQGTVLDSVAPKQELSAFSKTENRFEQLRRANPERAAHLSEMAQNASTHRQKFYEQMVIASKVTAASSEKSNGVTDS